MRLKEKVQLKWEEESGYGSDESNGSEENFWSINCPERFDDNTTVQIDRVMEEEEIEWTSNEEFLQESEDDYL